MPALVEDGLEELRAPGLVARRAGGVDAHERAQRVDGLLVGGSKVGPGGAGGKRAGEGKRERDGRSGNGGSS